MRVFSEDKTKVCGLFESIKSYKSDYQPDDYQSDSINHALYYLVYYEAFDIHSSE